MDSKSIEVIHARLEMQQEENAKAINALADTIKGTNRSVDILAKTIGEENKALEGRVHELIRQSDKCSERFSIILDKIEYKQKRLDSHNSRLDKLEDTKVDIKNFDKTVDKLWKIGLGIVGGLVAIIATLVKYELLK